LVMVVMPPSSAMLNLLGIVALSRDLFIGITVSTKLAPRRNTRHG
jgi:hypothetical protein